MQAGLGLGQITEPLRGNRTTLPYWGWGGLHGHAGVTVAALAAIYSGLGRERTGQLPRTIGARDREGLGGHCAQVPFPWEGRPCTRGSLRCTAHRNLSFAALSAQGGSIALVLV